MSQKRKSHRSRRTFQLESLEARQLMAADVSLVETFNLGRQATFLKSDFSDTILEVEPVGTDGSPGGADSQTSPHTGNDLRFTINNPTAFEDTGRLVFQVKLESDVGGPVSVDFQTLDGSAQSQGSARDYSSTSGTLNFLGHAGEVQEIVVDIDQDALVELDETLQVQLSNVQSQGQDVLLPQESQVFAEFDPFATAGDSSQVVTGTLGAVPFTLTWQASDGAKWGAQTQASVFDNTSQTFSTSEFTPSADGVDELGLVSDGSNQTLTVEFDEPVADPTFHFAGLGAAAYDFGATPDLDSIVQLSGNAEATLDGTVVRDADGMEDPSAAGSYQLKGTFSKVVVDLMGVSSGVDLHALQISARAKQGEGVIENDDVAIIDIMPLAGNAVEDRGPIGFGVTLSKPVDVAVEIPYSVQDINTTGFGPSADYIRPATDAKLTIPAGSQLATFDIQVVADQTVELDEAFFAKLGKPGASGRATAFLNQFAVADILNDDVAHVLVASQSAFERDGQLPFDLSLSRPVDVPVTLQFSTLPAQKIGDATPNDDFQSFPVTSYVIPAGDLVPSSSPTVKIIDDNRIEIAERVSGSVVVSAAFGREVIAPTASPQSFIGNDDKGLVSIHAVGAVVEASGAQLKFQIKLTDGNGQPMVADAPVTGRVNTTGMGTATASKDFTPLLNVPFNIGANATTVTVNVHDDDIVEFNESVEVEISNITAELNGSKLDVTAGKHTVAVGTIVDPDTSVINLRANRVPETVWTLPFDIVPSNPIDAPATVEFTTLDLTGPGSAEHGKDYIPEVARQISIPEQGIGTARVLLFDDQEVEGDEVIDAEIAHLAIHPQLAGRVSIGTNEARGTIIDDDGVLVSLVGRSAAESADHELGSLFEVTLDRPHTEDITVEVSTVDQVGEGIAEAGKDYTPLRRATATIPAGSTSVGIALPVNDDEIVELDESVKARIDSVVGGKASVLVDEALGVIINDDFAQLTLHDAVTLEDSGAIGFRVTSDKPIDHDISLLFDATSPIISADTATAGVDYAPIQLEFFLPKNTTESSSLVVPVVADQLIEGTESFTASLSILDSAGRDVIAGSFGVDFATGTIVDDDFVILDPPFGDWWPTFGGGEDVEINDRISHIGGTEAPRSLDPDFESQPSLPVDVDLHRPNTLVIEDLNDEPNELASESLVPFELAAIDAVFTQPNLLG